MPVPATPKSFPFLRDLILWVGIPMLFSYSLMDPWNLPRWMGLGVFLGVGAAWAGLQKDPALQLPRGFWLWTGLWMGWMGLSTFQAPHVGEALYWVGMRVMALILVVWLSTAQEKRARIPLMLAIWGGLEAMLGIAEVLHWVDMRAASGIPSGTAGNPNLYGSLLVLILPFALLLASERPLRTFGWTATALILVGAILSGSMAVGLALGLMAGLVGLLLLVGKRMTTKANGWSWVMTGMLLLVILAPIAWALLNFDGTTRVDATLTSFTERAFLWRETANMIAEQPLSGHGPAGWKYSIMERGILAPSTLFGGRYYAEPHNDFLAQAAESGILGALLYITIWLLLFRMAVRQGLMAHDAASRVRGFLMAAGIVGWCVFSSVHFPMERMDHMIIIAAYAAMILSYEKASNKGRPLFARVVLWSIAVMCIGLLGFGILRIRHEKAVGDMRHAKARGNWNAVLTASGHAQSVLFPTEYYSSTPIAWYRGLALYQLGNHADAVAAFQSAYHANPHHPHVLNNLASAFVAVNQLDSAVTYYQKALTTYPEFPDPYLNLAQIHTALGDTGKAIVILEAYPKVSGQGTDFVLGALDRLK
jgi:O-antigen ligase